MSELAQKREALLQKQKSLREVLAEAKDPSGNLNLDRIKSITGTVEQKQQHIRKLNEECSELGRTCEILAIEEKTVELAGRIDGLMEGPYAPGAGLKSLGELYTQSPSFKTRSRGSLGAQYTADLDPRAWLAEQKATMATSAGWAPQAIRSGVVVPIATRPVQILDLLPMAETSQATVVYMAESTLTSGAAETAEASAYAQSTLVLTETTSPVRKIATFLPTTDEQLDDVPMVQGYINSRLLFMVRQRLDLQVLTGNGTPPNLTGILNVGSIQTQAKGADTAMDAIYKAMVKVMITGRAFPSGHILHPTDWQNIRLLKDTQGRYIWGSPGDTAPDRLWGLPVAQCDASTAGTSVVADFANFTQLVFRRNVDVQIGFVNDDFVKGQKSIRADVRVAFVVYRAAAICTVTGL